jgi:hypothetical protein
MTLAIRLLASLILLAGGLAGAGSVHPDLEAVVGWQTVQSGQNNSMIENGKIVVARIGEKEKVTLALLAGDLDLFEAAAWFRELNLSPKNRPDQTWQRWPGRCDGEKLCRQVIAWAGARLETTLPPSLARARMREMEAVLKAHLAQHGNVILPSL